MILTFALFASLRLIQNILTKDKDVKNMENFKAFFAVQKDTT